MPPQELAFAAPGPPEMWKTAGGVVGGASTGVIEGVIVKMAPQLGALEAPFTWAALLGIPAVGIAGALFLKGALGDVFGAVAAGGAAVAGFTLPAMLMPDIFSRRAPAQLGAPGVKQLMAGPLGAPQRAQAAGAKALLNFSEL
ncbi:unnamed protein product [marine sediment metagenome]|uniref:Uncharacterized protein n=1 Tax=marine sediment metagenome TaxID=412755 RepID=X1TCN4_9ZZZZ